MKTIYLVRHGETPYTEENRLQGRIDIELSNLGRETAAKIGRFLFPLGIEEIYTSPLSRAVETATIVSDILNLPVPLIRQELIERGLGIFEGLSHDSQEYELLRASYNNRDMDFRPQGGESYQDIVGRVQPFIDYLVRSPASRVLVVGHAGVNKVVMGILLGRLQEICSHYRPHHNEVYEIDVTNTEMKIHKV